MLEKITQLFKHPFWDALSNLIKKFKSSKSYWSVSSLILIFTFREAIAWKFGSAIRTFCEEQAKGGDYATVWDIVGFVFNVGGSIELVLLGVFCFVGVSVVKVKAPELKEELEEIKALIRMHGGDETLFLQKYFGEDYQTVLENPQTYHNLKVKLLDSSTNIEELLKEKDKLLKKIQAQSLKSSIQKLVDRAFKELRYEDVRTLLDEFIKDNQDVSDDLIKAHFQKALAYIEELEYQKAKVEFEEFIPLGIKNTEILYMYSNLYYTLGEYDKVLECNIKALGLNMKEFGESHYSMTKYYNQIGLAWHSKGEYEKAMIFFNKELKIRLDTLGGNPLDTATNYNNIGLVWHSRKEYDKAIELFDKGLMIVSSILGESDFRGSIYNNIGGVWYSQKKYDKAIEYFNKSLNINLTSLGENHPSIAIGYNSIGAAWYNQGKFDEAMVFYDKALEILLSRLGENHSSTAITYNNIGGVLYNQGKYNKAIEFYGKAVFIAIPILGEKHINVERYKNNLERAKEKL